jgi:hypothetical protein
MAITRHQLFDDEDFFDSCSQSDDQLRIDWVCPYLQIGYGYVDAS